MTVSIIIAVKTWQRNLEECINKCQELDFSDFEVIVAPDEYPERAPSAQGRAVKIIPTGNISPGQKRDMAMTQAQGEILAFIDDDAYPDRDWLKNAVKNFVDPDVAAVGGPAITPPEDNSRQRASGRVYSSILVSGKYVYRYRPLKMQQVDDYPSCNFLVRKSVMQDLGGFDTRFWPGEDTKLCLEIAKKLNKKIIYDPAVKVYHHRRPLFMAHLRQVANYALHRGYFVKKYPATSLRPSYFIPTLLLLFILTGGVISFFNVYIRQVYLLAVSLYLFSAFISSICAKFKDTFLVFTGIVLTHLVYGFYFLKGIASTKLKEAK